MYCRTYVVHQNTTLHLNNSLFLVTLRDFSKIKLRLCYFIS